MSNGDRWMPLYVADYLGDTMHLTTLQHGAYVLLLMHYWRTGPLPDDHEALAAIVKLEPVAWKGVWARLSGFFTANGDGTLHQKRMDWELRRWGEISGKRRDAGKRGAEAKHRSHPSKGSAPPTALPHKPPEVVPRHIIPQPSAGKTLAIATNLPVDNLAIATALPPALPDVCQPDPGNCQDFATHFASPPVPVQRRSYLLSSQEEGAREAKPGETEQDLPREPDHLELILRESLQQAEAGHKAGLMSKQRNRTLDVQRAAAAKPQRSKACYVTGPTLAALRKQAGIWVAPQ